MQGTGIEDYVFTPVLEVLGVTSSRDGGLLLTTAERADGVLYTLALVNVIDPAGRPVGAVPQSESGVLFSITLDSQPPQVLWFGQTPTATNGPDSGLDEELQTGQTQVHFVCPSGELLQKDMRGSDDPCRWKLMVSGGNTREPLEVSWNVALPNAGKTLLLQRIVDELPTGRAVDMAQQESIMVTENSEFEIAHGTAESFTFDVGAGWSLLGNPLMSTQVADDLFRDPPTVVFNLGSLWYWQAGRYRQSAPDAALSPERGHWAYSLAGGLANAVTGIQADGKILLRPGRNLICPTSDCTLPEMAGVENGAWSWNATLGQYETRDTGATLTAGRGYWIHVNGDEPVLVDLGQ